MTSPSAVSGIGWQPFKEALGRLILEITESAVLGCLEPNPISSCYDDELPRVRKAILRSRDGKLARFRDQVNRNAFVLACGDYADGKAEEHLLIGYGFRHGSTTKVEGLHHVIGGANAVRLPDVVSHAMWDYCGHHKDNELLIFHNHPYNPLNFLLDNLLWHPAPTGSFLKPARCIRSSSSAARWDRAASCFISAKTAM